MKETSPLPPLPANACDAHLHLYDSALIAAPAHPNPLADCDARRYRTLREALGLRRAVVVTPAPHVDDNRVTLNAIHALGANDTRGIAVVFPDATDAELQRLNAGGIRGVRYTIAIPKTAVTRIVTLPRLAPMLAALGWHAQLHMTPAQIVEHRDLLTALPCAIVFDHMARLADTDADHPAWDIVESLLRSGDTWVKLSGHYLARDAATARATAVRLAALAPERVLWGSDWPHPTEMPSPPDTRATLAALHDWLPDAALRQRALVENPARLYGFA